MSYIITIVALNKTKEEDEGTSKKIHGAAKRIHTMTLDWAVWHALELFAEIVGQDTQEFHNAEMGLEVSEEWANSLAAHLSSYMMFDELVMVVVPDLDSLSRIVTYYVPKKTEIEVAHTFHVERNPHAVDKIAPVTSCRKLKLDPRSSVQVRAYLSFFESCGGFKRE